MQPKQVLPSKYLNLVNFSIKISINKMGDNENEINDDLYHSVLFNITDPMHLISKEQMLNAIMPGDAAIDIIGIVKSIETPPSIEKNGITLEVLNFTIECENKIRVSLAVWNEDIARLKPFIVLNNLIHIDSPFARPQKSSSWTNYKNYVLTCRSNTIINTLQSWKSIQNESITHDCKQFNNIQECIDYKPAAEEMMIILEVFIKTEFRKDGNKSNRYIGVVTDCKLKLITYIYDFDKSKNLDKGQKIKMTGRIVEDGNKLIFEAMSTSDIIIITDEKLSEEELENFIIKMPKRKSDENTSNENVMLKKSKMEC